MKNYFIRMCLFFGIISTFAGAVTPQDFTLQEGEVKNIELSAEHVFSSPGKPGGTLNAKKFNLEKNSTLNIHGEVSEEVKNIRGLYIEGKKFGNSNPSIKNGANLSINISMNKEAEMKKGDVPIEGIYINSRGGATDRFHIEKNGKLNIEVYANQDLEVENNLTGDHENKKDLFHQLLKKSVGLTFDIGVKNSGEMNIISTGRGIRKGNYKNNMELEFEEGSKTKVKAGLIALDATESKVTFKKGSYAELIGGAYGIIAAEANFEEGSKVKAMGKYGLGNYVWKGKGDQFWFHSGSEVDILANEAAFYAISLHGKTKANAKAKNLFKQANTRIEGSSDNLDILTFESGSTLEGNIVESPDLRITMEKGSKFFVDEKVEARELSLDGDLCVGAREAYENIQRKTYQEEIESMDGAAGASVILWGKLKEKHCLQDLKAKMPYEEVSPEQYNTVHFDGQRGLTLNLNAANLHLKLGGKWGHSPEINDKLTFSNRTSIKGIGANIILHPVNISGIKKDMSFDLLEEEKKNGEYDLEKLSLNLPDTELGPLVFTREDKKLADKYIISLRDTGKLSKSAISSMNFARDSYEWNKKELQEIQQKIFVKKDVEVGENFWILSSQENFTNKETRRKWKENNLYAGYDHTFGPRLSLGFFAGKSEGGINSTAQGVYIQKDFDSFYMGTLVKRTAIEQEKKRNHSSDISFMIGHQWDNKSNIYTDNRLMITRGHMSSHQYTEGNGMITQREKFNYVDGEFRSRIGYGFNSGSIFAEVGLGKHILGKQRILWNGKVQEELKHDGLDKKIGVGGEWKFRQHKIDMKISKEYSRYYKSDIKMSFGYSYKF